MKENLKILIKESCDKEGNLRRTKIYKDGKLIEE